MIIDPNNLPMYQSGHEKWLMTLDLRHPERSLKVLPIDQLLTGSVYYPASRFDGRPVQYLGRRIQSFVYVDYLASHAELMSELADVDKNFKGYRLAAHRSVETQELSGGNPWSGQPAPCLQTDELRPRIQTMWPGPLRDEVGIERPNESFCEWMIFERKPGFGSEHGPNRFSILHLHADGVASYQALYWTRGIAPTVLCIIQPGTSWDEFKSDSGCLATLVLRSGRPVPPYLVCGGQGYMCYDKAFWPNDYPDCIGYFKFELGNGLWAHREPTSNLFAPNIVQPQEINKRASRGAGMSDTISPDDDIENGNSIELLPFYVYELRDPRTNSVFYVGKGTKNRLEVHSADEENSKSARIHEIERAGQTVVRIIVGRFRTEEEAFAVEAVFIKWVYGFSNLTNLVHGHRHRLVRPYKQKTSARYASIPGIARNRPIRTSRDGTYTEKIRDKLSQNQIFEKLESLRDALRQNLGFHGLNVGEPDLLVPSDPCILVTGFEPSSVQLQIKMQLTGETVVLNFVPSHRHRLDAFETALTTIAEPFVVKSGNTRFGGKYSQTHDFKTTEGGYPGGIPQDDVNTIARYSSDAMLRLTR